MNNHKKLKKMVKQVQCPKCGSTKVQLSNAERVKLGLQPATWDAECERIALLRAAEFSELPVINGSNAHAGFYKYQEQNYALGECVAWGYMSASGAVNGWMNSTGHRECLMEADRTKLAVVRLGSIWVAINSW